MHEDHTMKDDREKLIAAALSSSHLLVGFAFLSWGQNWQTAVGVLALIIWALLVLETKL